ncbi:phytoene/squalene synthase family protein [bacterium]|nr:phytoene/squalene synthase family protein [bacterium]
MPLTAPTLARPPSEDLERAWKVCREIVLARAKNFSYAFIFLPLEKRRALDAVYAFCRIADDHADDDALPLAERRARLETLLARVRRVVPREGEPLAEAPAPHELEDLVALALARAAASFPIRREDLEAVVSGCLQDLTVTRYATWAELRAYCEKVASAVGLACLEVFEHEDGDGAREPAVELGLAMQLTNIVRDVTEDLARDRVYLPREDLARFGVDEAALRKGELTAPVRDLLAFEVARARELFASAERLYPLIPERRARACPRTLAALYTALLDEIERRGFDVFRERAALSAPRKLALALSGLVRSVTG